MLRYLDVVLIVIPAPVPVLVGVPAAGYGVGAATWIVLRGLERVIDRRALAIMELTKLVALRVATASRV
jgi:hypothetical protein